MCAQAIERARHAWPNLGGHVFVPQSMEDYHRMTHFLDCLVQEVGERTDHPLSSLLQVLCVLLEFYESENAVELLGL